MTQTGARAGRPSSNSASGVPRWASDRWLHSIGGLPPSMCDEGPAVMVVAKLATTTTGHPVPKQGPCSTCCGSLTGWLPSHSGADVATLENPRLRVARLRKAARASLNSNSTGHRPPRRVTAVDVVKVRFAQRERSAACSESTRLSRSILTANGAPGRRKKMTPACPWCCWKISWRPCE